MNRNRLRRRPLLATATVAVLLAAGTVVAHPGTASAEDDRRYVVCAARACLFIVERLFDRDGDGVTDVDEERLGTDPDDPSSTPPARKLIDELLDRQLPSFERHLTELVLLPTLAPDGHAIETGLGEFNLRDGDADLLKNIGIVITEIVDRNGFEAAFGLRLSGLKPGVGRETPPKYPFDQPEMIGHLDEAAYSDGTVSNLRSAGANAGKTVQSETLGSPDHPYMTFSGNGETGVTKTYEVNYTDGSKDKVTHLYLKDKDGSKTVDKSVTSYDKNGDPVSVTSASGHMWTDPDGTKHTTVEYNKPLKDSDGNVIGDQHVKIQMVEKKDGSTQVTTTTTTTHDDGTTKVERTDVKTGPKCDDCKKEEKKEDEEYVDPDYIGFDIVTPEDWARLEFRIKQVGMPGSGEGGGGPLPEQPPNPDQCTKCGDDGTMVLMDPDGVVVVAAGEEPNFNKRLTPDYDEWVQTMSGMAGQPVPVTAGGPGDGGSGGGSTESGTGR